MADRAKPLEYAPTGALYRGSQIRAFRQAKGWNLTHFSQLLGCQLSALSNIETNRVPPSPRLLARIATLLEVPLAELEQAPLPPLLAAKANGRTTPSRPAHRPQPAIPALTPPADPAPPATGRPAPAAPIPWTFGDQVEAIITSFHLAPREQQVARDLIVDLTRSLCLRLTAAGLDPPDGVAAAWEGRGRESV